MKTWSFSEEILKIGLHPHVIYDLGCFDGAQSLELAETWPVAKIFAFEADPQIAKQAMTNCWERPNISVRSFAIGDKNELATFHAADGANKECGSLLVPNGKYFQPMPTRPVQVTVRRLDSFIDDGIMPAPDAIWMDVQGNELAALKGLGKHIDNLKIFWAETAVQQYYQGQMLEDEFDSEVLKLGFVKVRTEIGIPQWFGDGCYVRKDRNV